MEILKPRNRPICCLDRVYFLHLWCLFLVGDSQCVKGDIFSNQHLPCVKKFYLFKALYTVWKLDKIYMFRRWNVWRMPWKIVLVASYFNLITRIGNRESKEDASSLFALGDVSISLRYTLVRIRKFCIIQSNSVPAYVKPWLCSKSVEYFCYILNFVDLWKEP